VGDELQTSVRGDMGGYSVFGEHVHCRDSPVSRCVPLAVLILDYYLSYVGLYLAY